MYFPLGTSHLLPAGGGRLYSEGVGNFLGDVLWGGENKMTYGQGGHVFRQVFCGGGGAGQIGSIGLSFH